MVSLAFSPHQGDRRRQSGSPLNFKRLMMRRRPSYSP
jgi:hypothetical protein